MWGKFVAGAARELVGGGQELCSRRRAYRGSFRGKGGRHSSRGFWFGSDSVSEKNQVLGLGLSHRATLGRQLIVRRGQRWPEHWSPDLRCDRGVSGCAKMRQSALASFTVRCWPLSSWALSKLINQDHSFGQSFVYCIYLANLKILHICVLWILNVCIFSVFLNVGYFLSRLSIGNVPIHLGNLKISNCNQNLFSTVVATLEALNAMKPIIRLRDDDVKRWILQWTNSDNGQILSQFSSSVW